MKQDKNKAAAAAVSKEKEAKLDRRLRLAEGTAVFGCLLVCAAMVAPLFNLFNTELLEIYKWVYLAGAVIYLIARVAGAFDPRFTMRIRRMRRMECWGGVAFVIAAYFWFHNAGQASEYTGSLTILRETIIFTLVGAMIQIIASWMIYFAGKKARKEGNNAEK